MKKFFMMAAMMLMSIDAFAQEGTLAVGGHLGYASYDGYSPLGIGAKFQYEFIENFRGEAEYNFWFAKKEAGVSAGLMDVNLNLHYLFKIADKFNVYPLGGISLVATHGDGDSENAIGFNVGGGAEYYIAPNLKVNADVKYFSAKKSKDITAFGSTYSFDVIKANGVQFMAGIAYVF